LESSLVEVIHHLKYQPCTPKTPEKVSAGRVSPGPKDSTLGIVRKVAGAVAAAWSRIAPAEARAIIQSVKFF
jgi:hypothetical protein